MNRAQRRSRTAAKFVKRARLWFRMSYRRSDFASWDDMARHERWIKMLRHGKFYGRSTMNNMEKHKANKAVRKESRRLCGSVYPHFKD